ncbi:MAG: hypothetical protein C7B45_17765 [Sulfobacillus acidophilus]|uniref:Uncharacterized protein n=1 Tax=Sulfobacillus acidophilus TaxID=53633 RepID=A0A2T2WC73_9FIRM|nr:MAG: hypothetical protein C7B45_17765 [Sulfobacillus acidophilus]
MSVLVGIAIRVKLNNKDQEMVFVMRMLWFVLWFLFRYPVAVFLSYWLSGFVLLVPSVPCFG